MKYYFKHKIENLLSVKSIITIEYLDLPGGYEYPEENHNFWEMVYADKGAIDYYVEATPTRLSEGELMFLSPGRHHRFVADSNNAPSIFVLCFDLNSSLMSFFNGYKTYLGKREKPFIENIINETRGTFKLPFREKLEVLDDPNLGGQQMIRINLEMLLITLLRAEGKKDEQVEFIKNDGFADTISDKISEYLKSRVHSQIYIDEICRMTGYSKSYVSQVFRQTTGESIMSYFNRLKIKEAKRLIRENRLTMSEISDTLSYNDPRYFSLTFKKITGKTPTEYKNSINKT